MSLNLTADDIDTVEDAGVLDGQNIKLCRGRGGFWFAVHKGKVISGGSHPAIVKHNISKMFPSFQPVMCKSEGFEDAVVDQHSHYLSDDLRKSGHDIFFYSKWSKRGIPNHQEQSQSRICYWFNPERFSYD